MGPGEMVGRRLGHYQITRLIGLGGMATVYLARDTYLNREVALKVFKSREDGQDSFLRRFEREAQIVAQLEHPNILTVYEYGRYNGMAYFVMPYLSSGSLRNYLQRQQRLSPRVALDLLTPILRALQYAHDRGLIHRDIKPDNMLFKADHSLVLSDFGLVKVLADEDDEGTLASFATYTNSIMGTPQYMSPEQIQGKAVPASDIYSLGVVLYELLTGRVPFIADTAIRVLTMHLYEPPPSLCGLNSELPEALEAVVLRALAKEAEQRYQRPLDFLYALTRVVAGQHSSQTFPLAASQNVALSSPSLEGVWFSDTALVPDPDPVAEYRSPAREAVRPALQPPSKHSQLSTAVLPATIARYATRQQKGTHNSTGVIPILVFLILLALIPLGIFWIWPVLMSGHSGAHIEKGLTSTGTTSTDAMLTTSCPAEGHSRPAVLTPLTNTNAHAHQSMIYLQQPASSEDGNATSAFMRYDSTTARNIVISQFPRERFGKAQLSPDGQWILFVTIAAQQSQLQLMRVDGKFLQTLYCVPLAHAMVPSITDIYWSPYTYADGAHILFSIENGSRFYQLLPGNGAIALKIVVPQGYQLIGWRDAWHLYLRDPDSNLYQATIPSGQATAGHDLRQIALATGTDCDDYTIGSTASVYVSHCAGKAADCVQCGSLFSGASSIGRLGDENPFFVDQFLAVSQIHSVSRQDILFVSQAEHPLPAKPNGLWLVDISGTQAPKLLCAVDSSTKSITLGGSSQEDWSNVSRDGLMFAFKTSTLHAPLVDTLSIGWLGNARLQTVVTSPHNDLAVIGWTDRL